MKDLFETGVEPTEVQEPVTQEPEVGEQENFDNWDKQKAVEAYRKKQSEADSYKAMLQKVEEDRIRAEERARVYEQMNRQPEPELIVPQKPQKPQKPQGYNKADAIAYPDSDSGKYEMQLENYYDARENYDEWEKSQLMNKVETFTKSLQQKENERIQSEEFAQRKAAQLNRLAKHTNGDLKKANEVFNFVQEAMGKDDPSWYVKLYESSQANPQVGLKTSQANQRGQRQQYNAPLGTISNDNNGGGDESKKFMNEIGVRKNNSHKLFQTEKR